MSSFSTYSTYNRYNHVLETPLTIDTRPILETPFSTSLNEMSYPQNSRHNSRESYYSNSSFGSTASSPTSVSALGHKNTSTLFVGDLSFLANEERLRELFSAYGRVDSIHLKKSDINHHRNHLSYGFVKFSCPEAAVLAYQACQGKMFLGRNLRLGFADDYHPSAHHHQPFTPSRQHTGNGMTTAQLYVTFASGNLFLPISELSLREVFAQFGPLSDVTIKQIETNQEVGIQSGYGFVHYPLTEEGIRAAMLATEKVHNTMINRVRFQCRFSHGLKKYLANMPPSFFQRPSPPFPPTQPTTSQQSVSHSQYHQFGSTIGLPVAKTVAGRISPSDEAKESHYFTSVNPQHGYLPTYTTTTTATFNEERLSLSSLYL